MRCNLCLGELFDESPFYYQWENKRFQGQRCRKCKLVAIDPLPTDDELVRLYAGEYFDEGLHGLDQAGVNYETLADRRTKAARDFVRRYIRAEAPAAGKLLEVGAAMGHFLQGATAEGFECTGIEFSSAAVARAKEKFGLDLILGNIETLDLSAHRAQWDVVYSGDLLEHLRDPNLVLGRICDLLTKDGLCVMALPGTFNLLSTRLATPLLKSLGRSKCLPDKPYHLYEFTTVTVKKLFEQHFSRVRVINHATPPGRLNTKGGGAEYVAKYFLQFLNWPLTGLTNRFGDRMTVIAHK